MSPFDKIIGYGAIKEFLEKVADALMEKDTLLFSDIQKIRQSVTVTEATL